MGFRAHQRKQNEVFECRQADSASVFGRSKSARFLIAGEYPANPVIPMALSNHSSTCSPVFFSPFHGIKRAPTKWESEIKMADQVFTFASSPFVPVAIGFFGLGTGYFIWGGQALFGFPKNSPEVNRTMGLWGFWMPGFMQFLTGIYLLTGLTWFNVFGKAAPLYMAGLAFNAFGIHWFAMAYRRYLDSSSQPDGWMAIAFLFLSILGADVFRRAGDVPVMLIFVGLTLIYAIEIPTRLLSWSLGGRLVGLVSIRDRRVAHVLHIRHDSGLALGAKAWV